MYILHHRGVYFCNTFLMRLSYNVVGLSYSRLCVESALYSMSLVVTNVVMWRFFCLIVCTWSVNLNTHWVESAGGGGDTGQVQCRRPCRKWGGVRAGDVVDSVYVSRVEKLRKKRFDRDNYGHVMRKWAHDDARNVQYTPSIPRTTNTEKDKKEKSGNK